MLLENFIRRQEQLSERIYLANRFSRQDIKLVAGVDTAYWQNADGKEFGVCCIAVIDFQTKEVVEKEDYYGEVDVPYHVGFLAFRELPLILKTAEKLKKNPDLYMFDGNGYLHPRHMGIATHASFYLDKPTIGVAKNYLRIEGAEFKEPQNDVGCYELIQSGNVVYGAVLRTRKNVKPVYVSCGNWIDLETSVEMTLHFADKNSHLPVTTRCADLENHIKRKQYS